MRSGLLVSIALVASAPAFALAQMDDGMALPEGPIPRVSRPIDSSRECLPASALAGADIVMLGQYGGHGQQVPYQIKGAQHGTTITQVVGDPGRPVVVVASAYESTVWDFSQVPAGRIRGVVASGFYAQAVAGVRGAPVALRHSSADNGQDADVDPTQCPDTYFAYGGRKAASAGAAIRQSFGRYPSRFLGAYQTPAFDLSSPQVPPYKDWPQPTAIVAERPIVTTGPRSGHEGIRQMLQSGILKSISSEDAAIWAARGARFIPVGPMARMGIGGRMGPNGAPYLHDAYLITRDVAKLPGGLGGALAVTFVIPEGVSAPIEAGHSTIYQIRGMRGIPPTSGPPRMPSFYSMMARQDTWPSGTMLHEARWNPDGSLISENLGTHPGQQFGGEDGPIGALTGASPQYNPFDIRRNPTQDAPPAPPILNPVEPGSSTTQDIQPATRHDAMIIAILVLASGGAIGVVLMRQFRKAGYPGGDQRPSAPMTASAPVSPAAPESDPRDRTARLSRLLQTATDLSQHDATVLALLRFKRTALKALKEPEYDEDIADELNMIVGEHIVEMIGIYLKAARRIGAGDTTAIEAELEAGANRLARRIEEILSIQSTRDADDLREQGAFLRARHPSTRLGDDPLG